MIGSAGADRFQFRSGFGSDRITDFQLRLDLLDLTGLNADPMTPLGQRGIHTVLQFDSCDTLLLNATLVAALSAGDFLI